MAKTIIRKVRFDFETSNLEKISKTIEKMKPILGKKEVESANQIQSQIETILKSMETNEGLFSADGVKLIRSEIDKISKSFRGLTDGFQLDPAILKEQNKLLEREAELQEKILENKKEIARLEKDVSGTDEHGFPKASRAVSQSYMPEGAISATSGNDLKRFSAWETSMKKVQEIFEELGIDSSNLEASLQKQHLHTERFTELAEKLGVALPFEEAVVQMGLFNETMNKSGLQASASQERIRLLNNEIGNLEGDIEDTLFKVGELNVDLQSGEGVTDFQRELSILREEVLNLTIALKDALGESFDKFHKGIKEGTEGTKKFNKETNDLAGKGEQSTVGKAAKNIIAYGSVYGILRRAYRETIRTVTDLDKALTDMAVVTTMSRKEAWGLTSTFQELAKQTGMTTTEIANLSTIYFRQGKALKDVIELTEVAAKAAKIAGISAEESANYLTAAINGFGLAAREAEAMSDKFAALAASSASSYEELAVGLSKFASQANLAGLSVDFALGLLAKGVETTREAPESIGTALKTVLARMRELTDLGKTMEDGMDVNRVDTALRQIGVSLRNASGEFRDMESVLTEVGQKWATLTSNQQANVAVSLAGTRQQSRLIAMFQDFDRTLDLVNTSLESEGATLAQHMNYMEGMEASMTRLTTAWQNFINSLVQSEFIIGIVKAISWSIEQLTRFMEWGGNVTKVLVAVTVALAVATVAYNKIAQHRLAVQMAQNQAEAAGLTISKTNLIMLALEKIAALAKIVWMKILTVVTIAQAKAAIAGGGAWATFWALATGPIGWVVGGIAAITAGIVLFTKSIKNSSKALEKENKELRKNTYELSQKRKKTQELINEQEKHKNTLFRTEEDISNEKEFQAVLVEEVENLKEQGYITEEVAYFADGRLDVEKNIQLVKNAQIAIEEEQRRNSEALVENARRRYDLLLKTKNLQSNKILEFLQGELEVIGIANRDQDWIKKMAAEDADVYSTYFKLEEALLEGLTTKQLETGLAGGLKDEFNDLKDEAKEVIKFREALLGEEDFSKQLELYEKGFERLSKTQKAVIGDEFRALELLFDTYVDTGKNILEGVDLSTEAGRTLSQALGLEETEQLFKRVAELMRTTTRAKAWSQAISEFTDDSETIAAAWEFASRDVDKLAIAFDSLTSRVNNINKKQEDFLSNSMTMSEAQEFLKEYGEILEDSELFEKFKRGEDLSLHFAEQILEERKKMEDEYQDLLERRSEGEEGLETQIRGLELLLMYKGEFANITQAQIKYNSLKERENTLSDLGLLTEEKRARLQRDRGRSSIELIREMSKESDEALRNLDKITEGMEGSVYEIIDGVAVLNLELFNQMGAVEKEKVEGWLSTYNEVIKEQLEMFADYMQEELSVVEEANRKKKDSYDKYFKALDRLEQKRDRKMTRDQIVQQLQRLEGASDERSRQKAKELRQELNELDVQSAKDEQSRMREDTLAALDSELEKRKEQAQETAKLLLDSLTQGGSAAAKAFAEAFDSITFDPETGKFGGLKQFRQGGMVDYTGIAMLHGSPGRPEAVLSADQTVAFKKMAEGLNNNKNFSSSDGVTIGNITIQTNSMNNNQDFKAAGRALAREFEAAISRRGIGVNTKR